MKKLHLNRLRKIVAHLRTGTFAHLYFNFGYFNADEEGGHVVKTKYKKERSVCGTAGCAIGELPAIFRQFKYSPNKTGFIFKDVDVMYSGTEVQDFLGIGYPEFAAMFMPNTIYRIVGENGCYPSRISPMSNATKEEVADHIENLINCIESGYKIKTF